MPKSEGSLFIDVRCIIMKFDPHIKLFDFPALQRILEKEQFRSKDEFIRKIVTLKNQKVIPRLTGLLLTNLQKVAIKANVTLSPQQETKVIEIFRDKDAQGKQISPVKLTEQVEEEADHSVGHSFQKSLINRHPDEIKQETATKIEAPRMKIKEMDINDQGTIQYQQFEGENIYFIDHIDERGYTVFYYMKSQEIQRLNKLEKDLHTILLIEVPRFSLFVSITMGLEHFIPFYVVKKLIDIKKFRQKGGNNDPLYQLNLQRNSSYHISRKWVMSSAAPNRGELLSANNIVLVRTLPNSKHYLQVLDVDVFGGQKHHLLQLCGNQFYDSIQDIIKLSASAYQMFVMETAFENSFKKVGLKINSDYEIIKVHFNHTALEPIIAQCKKDSRLSQNFGTKQTRKRKQSDFGVFNCDLLDD
ncbi:MAG: hypothetical protein EZS28_000868 [Streblomastix strix]|uniref:DDE-1 domain-containing protein n=1 Tax=Streblomastix strix TaxID=222440 RepID=A0A5J4X8N5_9EUKA|nr:MAG: hypothetical protein EZS28_000868 [Streblomastix strix]